MLKSHVIKDGIMHMTIYDFEEVGDELGAHTHDESTVHYCIVAAGVLRMLVTGEAAQILPAGSVVKGLPGEHAFVAVTPRARLCNVRYGGTV